ncbi:CGNR zinc finger domain-containing protein [Candidatus Binatia bacterium]|nr:CGNR zinc finger domain-containing protein [Candidatus Binatia bacterium]
MVESPSPFVVGGHLALDLLNTVAAPRGEPVEFLFSGAALLDWLVAAGALHTDEVGSLARRLSPSALDAIRRETVALREWLRPIVQRSASRRRASLSAAELRHLNELLARDVRVVEVVPSGRGYATRTVRRSASAVAGLRAPVVAAIADLFTMADFALVRTCAGPSCTLWFLDRTKGHRRRWCAMELCGNRAKVDAHRQRVRRG